MRNQYDIESRFIVSNVDLLILKQELGVTEIELNNVADVFFLLKNIGAVIASGF